LAWRRDPLRHLKKSDCGEQEHEMVEHKTANTRAVWSWAFYDFANSAFATLVVTFIYAAYFTQVIAPDPISGTALWSWAVTATALVVALAAPLLGAIADRAGIRKPLIVVLTTITVIACVALYPVLPGQVALALSIFVVANICFELALALYNAFLPDIAPPDRIGRISGYGWGLGYVGGLLVLVVALVTLIQPETPWFGFSREAGENIRATNLLVAVWFAVFSLPLLLWVRENRKQVSADGKSVLSASFRQFKSTFREIRSHRQIVRLLFARLFYNDGLVTVFAFGGIYAAGTFGFSVQEILVFGIVLNVAAGLGAVTIGHLDDMLGGKRTIQLSLLGLIAASLLAVIAPDRTWLWTAGLLIGIFVGPTQSASRSLMARMVPDDKTNEFFGFFAFSGKATAFLGPLLLGILTAVFGTQRAGIAIVVVFFILGLILLAGVDEEAGIKAAGRPSLTGKSR
jgi:UMF1 family MFS transporter